MKAFLLFISFSLFFTVPEAYGKKVHRRDPGNSSIEQVASFSNKKNAKEYASKLNKKGLRTEIRKSRVGGKRVYRVLTAKAKPSKQAAFSSLVIKEIVIVSE